MAERHGKLRLAASIVITVAVAQGCKNKTGPREPEGCEPPDCHMNPPPPNPPPPFSSGSAAPDPTATVPPGTTTATATIATIATDATATASPSATGVQPERVCWARPQVSCPPYDPKHPRTCNPPAPVRVPCGPDADPSPLPP
ncbi:MAG: hypothetical protein HY908_13630 [Myxococcales bacterium]|nr:hypothetical protein [Myxococcales bacterium]